MFKQFTDAEKLEMNRKAKAIVRGNIVASVIVSGFMAILPAQAKANQSGDWQKMVRYAMDQSVKAYGKSTYDHFCEPEMKLCTDFVYYPVQDKKIFLREVSNINDKIILRDVCTFSVNGDTRWCENFDTGARRTDMQDRNNRWVTVEGKTF
jgi:hypothetical protein